MRLNITDGPSKGVLVARMFDLAETAGNDCAMPIMFTVEPTDGVQEISIRALSLEHEDGSGYSFSLYSATVRSIHWAPSTSREVMGHGHDVVKGRVYYNSRRRTGFMEITPK